MGYHVCKLMLAFGIFVPSVNPWIDKFAAWLVSKPVTIIDDSHLVFNLDCRVCVLVFSQHIFSCKSQYPQHTTEWSIPFTETKQTMRELHTYLQKELASPNGIRPHFPIEVRFSAADDIWLSPSSGRLTTWIGIVQYKFVFPHTFTRIIVSYIYQALQFQCPI